MATAVPLNDASSAFDVAGRMPGSNVNMGFLRVFPQLIPEQVMVEEFQRLCLNSRLNRKVKRKRIPGSRSRWTAADEADFSYQDAKLSSDQLQEWMQGIYGRQLNLAQSAWAMHVTTTAAGETVVLNPVHHGLCDGRTALGLFASQMPEGYLAPEVESRTGLAGEVSDLKARAQKARKGIQRIRHEAKLEASERNQYGDFEQLKNSARATVASNVGGGKTSSERKTSLISVDSVEWQRVATKWNGSSNTLLMAITAQLVEVARRESFRKERNAVRVVLPVEGTAATAARARKSGEVQELGGYNADVDVTVPLAAPCDLAALHSAAKKALADGADRAVMHGAEVRLPGEVDAMLILPDLFRYFVAGRYVSAGEGVASNLGLVDQKMLAISNVVPTKAALLGPPVGTDLVVLMSGTDSQVHLAVAGDKARVGSMHIQNETLRCLEAWGLKGAPW